MTSNSDLWEECPPGEIVRMVDHLHAEQRRIVVTRWATVAAVVVLAVVGVFGVRGLISAASPQPITCSDVVKLLQSFRGEAPTEDAFVQKVSAHQDVNAHLENCPHCAEQYRKLRESISNPTSLARNNRSVALVLSRGSGAE